MSFTAVMANNDETDDYTSESEDDTAREITEESELAWRKTWAALKSKDPKIYDKSTVFFPETPISDDDEDTRTTEKKSKKSPKKKTPKKSKDKSYSTEDKNEKFLLDYFSKMASGSSKLPQQEVESDDEDDEELDKQDNFEKQHNFRYESQPVPGLVQELVQDDLPPQSSTSTESVRQKNEYSQRKAEKRKRRQERLQEKRELLHKERLEEMGINSQDVGEPSGEQVSDSDDEFDEETGRFKDEDPVDVEQETGATKKNIPIYNPKVHGSFDDYYETYHSIHYQPLDDLDMKFLYNDVKPENYGLTTEDILSIPSKELAKLVPKRTLSTIIDESEEARLITQCRKRVKTYLNQREELSSEDEMENEEEKTPRKKKGGRGKKSADLEKPTSRDLDKNGTVNEYDREPISSKNLSANRMKAYGLSKKQLHKKNKNKSNK